MTLIAFVVQLFAGALAFIRALPKEILYPLLTAIALIFLYEGISIPTVWPVSLVWSGSIIDGRVDRVRKEADKRCEFRIQKSIEAATKTDSAINAASQEEMLTQLQDANQRALAAQQQSKDMQDEILRLSPELQQCRLATESDRARLRR